MDKPARTVELGNAKEASVRLVEQYRHLGGGGGGLSLTVDHACRLMLKVVAMLLNRCWRGCAGHFFRNNELTRDEKRELLRTLVLRSFLYGAGQWVLRIEARRDSVRAAIMSFCRQSSWAVAGGSSNLLRDSEVCSVMRVLQPEELLHCERW